MSILNDKAEAYFEARKAYDEAYAEQKERAAAKKDAEAELVNAMLDQGLKSFGLDNGLKLNLRKACSISATEANRQATRDWLMDFIGDDSDYVHEVVNKKALQTFIEDSLKVMNFTEDEVPDFIKLSTRPAISVQGWDNFKK